MTTTISIRHNKAVPLPDFKDGEIPAVCGPTASGKSALALEIARRRNGEIVSVDSMQLYRGIEIGTAQPAEAEQREVPHHLIGCFDFHERVDVLRFVELADRAIADIRSRGKLPVLAGGTGLYLRTLAFGMDDLPANPELRKKLDTVYDSEAGFPALCARMSELDPAGLEKFRTCRRRLIRALEVRLLAGKSILELQSGRTRVMRHPIHAFRLELSTEQLQSRIAARTAEMLQNGWIEEARAAIQAGLLEAPTAHQALGYRLIGEFLNGTFDRKTLESRIVTATWQFARRQRTWFRHQEPVGEAISPWGACHE